jgi:hypothetical protein
VQDLGHENEHERRDQGEDQRRGADHADADRQQSSLPGYGVNQRSARDLAYDAGEGAKGKGDADLPFCPAEIG